MLRGLRDRYSGPLFRVDEPVPYDLYFIRDGSVEIEPK